MKIGKKKLLSGAKLTKALDSVVRDILHTKYPDPICFVCGKNRGWFHPQKNPKGCQVGHYISRRVYQLRWDLHNVAPQCSVDNYLHQYNILPYTNRIMQVYGKERIDYLTKKYNSRKMTTLEKRKILSDLTTKLEELKK